MAKNNRSFAQLQNRLQEIDDLDRAVRVLYWDKNTYMPPGGGSMRSRQIATLSRLIHERRIDPALGSLLDQLAVIEENEPYDSFEASLIRVARRDYERAVKVPPAFMEEFSAHSAESYQVWTRARPENDFAAVRPMLEKSLDYSRQYADFFPGYEHVADPLIDESDYGMKVSTVRPLLAELRGELVPLVNAVSTRPAPDDSFLYKDYPEDDQLDFSKQVVEALGFNFHRGRLDLTPHPFEISIGIDDVRINTRVTKNRLDEALFSTIHEAGHGMYEQGIDPSLARSPLSSGTSSAVHESQSRLWENLVGRGLAFWRNYFPKITTIFPDQLRGVSLEDFYRAINKVQRSLIRVDADELTYNLHVMIRFELELEMLEGKLAIKDLAEAWHARFESDLGLRAPDDRDGVLQDVHWFSGLIGGGFQGYTLGNILSAAFFEAANDAHPEIVDEIENGHFATLHAWLKENIYRHGRKFTANELVRRVTGDPLSTSPYIRYLNRKFSDLYDL